MMRVTPREQTHAGLVARGVAASIDLLSPSHDAGWRGNFENSISKERSCELRHDRLPGTRQKCAPISIKGNCEWVRLF